MERFLIACVYATMAGLGAIVSAGQIPIDAVAWCGFALAVISAGWGKYSSSQNVIMPNREVLTEAERRAKAGLPPKKPE